jgi:hypothetical protein
MVEKIERTRCVLLRALRGPVEECQIARPKFKYKSRRCPSLWNSRVLLPLLIFQHLYQVVIFNLFEQYFHCPGRPGWQVSGNTRSLDLKVRPALLTNRLMADDVVVHLTLQTISTFCQLSSISNRYVHHIIRPRRSRSHQSTTSVLHTIRSTRQSERPDDRSKTPVVVFASMAWSCHLT